MLKQEASLPADMEAITEVLGGLKFPGHTLAMALAIMKRFPSPSLLGEGLPDGEKPINSEFIPGTRDVVNAAVGALEMGHDKCFSSQEVIELCFSRWRDIQPQADSDGSVAHLLPAFVETWNRWSR